MCQYSDVITDVCFVSIDSLLLELCKGESVPTDTIVEDGAYVTSISDQIYSSKNITPQRQHTANEKLTFDDLNQSNMRFDKVNQFCLHPPGFFRSIDMVSYYYRWLYINIKNKLSSIEIDESITTC